MTFKLLKLFSDFSSLKENEESAVKPVKAEPVTEFEPLPDSIFTEPLLLESGSVYSEPF